MFHHGLYRLTHMHGLMWVKNTPGISQRAMDVLQSKVKWQFALWNLDDIVVFWQTHDKDIDHVCQALTVL